MKLLHKLAMAAGVFAAPSLASAQYYSYGAPATLPAPASQVRPMGYISAYNPNPSTYSAESVQAPTAIPAQDGVAPSVSQYDNALAGESGCTTCNQGGGYVEGDGSQYWGNGLGCGDCCCGPSWYGSVAGLYMRRNRPNPYQLSFDTTNPVGQLILNTDSFGNDWQGGFEVRVGKYIGCSSAIELGYWTLSDFGGDAYAYDPPGVGGLNTPFDFRSLNFAGTPVNDLFDNSQAHYHRRSNDVQNVEINFVNFPMNNPCSRMQASWLAGFRYFRFTEDWLLASSDNNRDFGVDPANEAYWNINTENNLFGLQIGGRGSYCVTQKLSVFAAPRVGVYWNNMSLDYSITTGNGVSALNISSDEDIVSLMAQLDVGVNYQVTPCIGIWGGYRVMAISGIALSDQQIPFLQDDLNGIAVIDHNSNLVLHGLMGGLTFTY